MLGCFNLSTHDLAPEFRTDKVNQHEDKNAANKDWHDDKHYTKAVIEHNGSPVCLILLYYKATQFNN